MFEEIRARLAVRHGVDAARSCVVAREHDIADEVHTDGKGIQYRNTAGIGNRRTLTGRIHSGIIQTG